MSQDTQILAMTFTADADLSASKGCGVKISGAGLVDVSDTTDFAIGILDNKPTEGQPARVVLGGTAKVCAAAAFSVGDRLVVADSDGKLDTAGAEGHVVAIALEAATDEDDLVEALLVHFYTPAA